MTRYVYLTRHQVVERGVVEIVAEHWWRYRAVCAVRGDAANPLGFARSYRAIRRWKWNADGEWGLLHAARSIFRRVWSYGF